MDGYSRVYITIFAKEMLMKWEGVGWILIAESKDWTLERRCISHDSMAA
jgi:hypothetical protein